MDGGRVTDHELNEPFDMMAEAYTIWREWRVERRSRRDEQPRTYHRRGAADALTAELEASTWDADEAAWRHLLQSSSSADLLTETGATSETISPAHLP